MNESLFRRSGFSEHTVFSAYDPTPKAWGSYMQAAYTKAMDTREAALELVEVTRLAFVDSDQRWIDLLSIPSSASEALVAYLKAVVYSTGPMAEANRLRVLDSNALGNLLVSIRGALMTMRDGGGASPRVLSYFDAIRDLTIITLTQEQLALSMEAREVPLPAPESAHEDIA